MKTFALTIALLSTMLAGQTAEQDRLPTVALPAELERVLRDYERGWAKGDGEALSLLFTEDGYVMQPGKPPVKGREAIAGLYQREGSPLHLRAFAYAMDGNVAYILGGYAYEPNAADHGKYTLTLRKVGGKWMIASDMDSSNHAR